MIYTVTLNPAVDYYIGLDNFQEERLNQVKTAYTLPGGKGINVSKVLKNFSVESVCLGFVGGFTGEYIKKDLITNGIKEKFVEIKEPTRINIKMKTESSETEVAGKSPDISKIEFDRFFENLKDIKEGDMIVLSGSVPKSLNEDIYIQIIKFLPKDIKVIVDTRGETLKKVLKEGIFLVKPNKDEIQEFFGEIYETDEEIIKAGQKLRDMGSENVLISLGKDGSILITKDKVYRGNVPKGQLISSVGAGDSMVAGFLYGLEKNEPIETAYKYGIASGSSTAFSEGLTTYENMKNLLSQIKIKKM